MKQTNEPLEVNMTTQGLQVNFGRKTVRYRACGFHSSVIRQRSLRKGPAMIKLRWIACLFVGLLAIVSASTSSTKAADPEYHVLKKIKVPGEGGWDYLTCDPEARRLYISRSNRVQVMDV